MNVEKTQRTTFIFTIWTFLYFSWFRWFMLENWQFNIFSGYAWKSLFNEWWYKGWIIQGSYFWIFIISLFLFIPVWIWGLCFFLTRNYNKYFEKLFWDSIYKKKTKKVQSQNRNIKVKKKKSYREVRPRALTGTPQSIAPITSVEADPEIMNKAPSSAQKLFMEEKLTTSADTSFSSRELSDDFEGESPFSQNAQDFDVSMIASDQKIERLDENLPEIMTKSGAVVIEKPTIENSTIDYMAISKDQVFFVLTDAEKEEIKNLVVAAAGMDVSRGDVVNVSSLKFTGIDYSEEIEKDKKEQQEFILEILQNDVIFK